MSDSHKDLSACCSVSFTLCFVCACQTCFDFYMFVLLSARVLLLLCLNARLCFSSLSSCDSRISIFLLLCDSFIIFVCGFLFTCWISHLKLQEMREGEGSGERREVVLQLNTSSCLSLNIVFCSVFWMMLAFMCYTQSRIKNNVYIQCCAKVLSHSLHFPSKALLFYPLKLSHSPFFLKVCFSLNFGWFF